MSDSGGEEPTKPKQATDTALKAELTAVMPKITLHKGISSSYGGPKLSKEKGNWREWDQAVCLHLRAHALLGYIKGTVECPDIKADADSYHNWKTNDDITAGALMLSVEASECDDLDAESATSKEIYDKLRARHEQDGPINQTNLLAEAFSIRISKTDKDTTARMQKICANIRDAFRLGGGKLSEDLLQSIAMLHAISADFPQVRTLIVRELADAGSKSESSNSPSRLYAPLIRTLIEREVSLIRTFDTKPDSAFAAASGSRGNSKGKSSLFCENCRTANHTKEYCVKEGGGMAGKTIEQSRAKRLADKGIKGGGKRPGGSKVAMTVGGKVFLVDTADMIPVQADTNTNQAEFAGLASANIEELNTGAEGKMLVDRGWIAIEEETQDSVSIDWADYTSDGDLALAVAPTLPHSPNLFFTDTGATVHISNDRNDFINIRPVHNRSVKGVGGSMIIATAIGDIKLKISADDFITLRDALLIPNSTVRLISVSKMARDSRIVSHFDDEGCWFTLKDSGRAIARGTLQANRNLYALNTYDQEHSALVAQHQPSWESWHYRLGHANYQTIYNMAKTAKVEGMPSTPPPEKPPKCEFCVLGKQVRSSVPKQREEGSRATRKLEKVWVDLSGPHSVSRLGNRYVMNIVDDFSAFPWSIPLKSKDQAASELKKWQLARENELGTKVAIYRTDNGELKSHEMDAWFASKGTVQETTAPHTSAHIGRVERMHRTLMNKARTMRIYAKCPPNTWDEFYLTACYLHARTSTRSLNGKTPYEFWYGKKPNVSHLREIGCRAFVLTQPSRSNPKVFKRSTECVLVGYELHSKAYRCYHRQTGKVYSSYHVTFLESHDGHPATFNPELEDLPPSEDDVSQHRSIQEITQSSISDPIFDDEDEMFIPAQLQAAEAPTNDPAPVEPVQPIQPPAPRRSSRVPVAEADRLAQAVQESKDAAARKAERLKPANQARAERRKATLAARKAEEEKGAGPLPNPESGLPVIPPAIPSMSNAPMQSNTETAPPVTPEGESLAPVSGTDSESEETEIEKLLEEAGVTAEERKMLEHVLTSVEMEADSGGLEDEMDDPKSWKEARDMEDGEEWEEAAWEELDSLKEMKVYELVPLESVPKGMSIRKGKLVFKRKKNELEKTVRRKVRFVLKGFEQIYGRDYTKTTSPTARMEASKLLLHLAKKLGWDIQQLDVKTAFLYSLLPEEETQYMYQPEGFEAKGKETWVWKLKRGLYGMKQSGRLWNGTMNDAMIGWNFKRLGSDACIYYRKEGEHINIVLVHVDDFLCISPKKEDNERFKAQMRERWTIKELGVPRQFLGLGVSFDDNHVYLSQIALIDRIIAMFGQTDAYPTSIPMDPGLKLRRPNKSSLTAEELAWIAKTPFRSLIGMLLYLAIGTRPDIAYAVQQLSQFLDCFTSVHWNAAIRVVRYLKGTRDLKLRLGGKEELQLVGFTDSDWANCLDTRRSVGGYGFSLGSGLISWTAKKQATVAASSCEAEYVAAYEACKENEWLRSLLAEIDFKPEGPTTVLCDNRAAIIISEDPLLHARVKHIDIKYHFLRERAIEAKSITLRYINTNDNVADMFTKALPPRRFARLRELAGLVQ
ncbi:hypothetical protein NMY22_g4216 [Coprinellus aureogranulatus]|nr:hypothetical protein NMY22_g4216 [Coprinellus aureogranulatus]